MRAFYEEEIARQRPLTQADRDAITVRVQRRSGRTDTTRRRASSASAMRGCAPRRSALALHASVHRPDVSRPVQARRIHHGPRRSARVERVLLLGRLGRGVARQETYSQGTTGRTTRTPATIPPRRPCCGASCRSACSSPAKAMLVLCSGRADEGAAGWPFSDAEGGTLTRSSSSAVTSTSARRSARDLVLRLRRWSCSWCRCWPAS